MAIKTERLEARVSPDERARIERAASLAGMSVSAFMVSASVGRADEITIATTTTIVPADYFDDVLAALDEPEPAPQLAKAADKVRRDRRIRAR